MNIYYEQFILVARTKASDLDLNWFPTYDQGTGKIHSKPIDMRWNISAIRMENRGPTRRLSTFGSYKKIHKGLNEILSKQNKASINGHVISHDWKELYKAVIIDQAFIKNNKAQHTIDNIGKSILILASCCPLKKPWDITWDDIQLGYNAALLIGGSGKVASNFEMTVKTIIDTEQLFNRAPLKQACMAYDGNLFQEAEKQKNITKNAELNHHKSLIKFNLNDRRHPQKLPEAKAFWELIRIIFTEKPKTYSDAIRFEVIKIGSLTGMRATEFTGLPLNTIQIRESLIYSDDNHGISQSMFLEYYRAKQSTTTSNPRSVLIEAVQAVPILFENIISNSVQKVKILTEPLRMKLLSQIQNPGRIFPEYNLDQFVQIIEIHPKVTGQLWGLGVPIPKDIELKYRNDLSEETCSTIHKLRYEILTKLGSQKVSASKVLDPIRKFWHTYHKDGLVLYNAKGQNISTLDYHTYVLISELEKFIKTKRPTNLSDIESHVTRSGAEIKACDWLYLIPKRSLIEQRNNGLLDPYNISAIGTVSGEDVINWLSGENTIFKKYGETEEDRKLSIKSHSFRHLHTTELLRHGVVDTVVAKRQNRKNVKQNEVYDHRTLTEELDHIDIPELALEILPLKAQETLKLIQSGHIRGPLIDKFLECQKTEGDEAAFEFLATEADGLHVTPFGYCLNSFTVDPCPKHLQCLEGCRHFTKTDIPEHEKNLLSLKKKTEIILEKLRNNPIQTPGYSNQLKHCETTLINITKIIESDKNTAPFPNGLDVSKKAERTGTSVLDTFPLQKEMFDGK